MNKIKAIFLKEYLERVRRRSFFIGLLLVPFFMAVVVIVPIWLGSVDEEAGSRVMIVDASGLYKGALEEAIQSELPSGEPRFRYLDRNDSDMRILGDRLDEPLYLDALLEADLLDWYLMIPASAARVDTLEFHGRVVSNLNLIGLLDSHYTDLRRRERLRDLDLPPGLLDEIDVGTEIRTFQRRSGETSEAGFLALWGSTFLMVMILYMTIMGFGVMIQRSILEDKNLHVTEVVLSSMSASRFLAGKVLGIGAVGLTQYLAWLAMASLITVLIPLSQPEILESIPAVQPMSYFYFVLFYILGFLLFSGLLAAVAAICTTDQEAQQFMQPIILMLILPLIMMIYIFQNPDAPISVVMSLIPVFTPLVMFMRINVSSPPLWQILLALGLMLAALLLTFVVAGRIFRVGILMTGKRASLVEALRWVRQP